MAEQDERAAVSEAWGVERYRVRARLLMPMLGTVPEQASIFAAHIATKQGKALKREGKSDEDIKTEIATTLEGYPEVDQMSSGKTTFFKDATGYYVRDYLIKGTLKDSARCLKQFGALKQLRDKVVHFLFVRPVKIHIAAPDEILEVCERPLRAETPMGPRVAISRSDMVPAGTELEFELHSLRGVLSEKCIKTLLDYGTYPGFGQWRGSGSGSYEVTEFEAS